MVRLSRYCALVVGALLMILAVALALRVESTLTSTPTNSNGRAEVAQAVSELQGGCFTCHTLQNDLPNTPYSAQLVLASQFERPSYAVRQPKDDLPVALSNAQINAELIKLGQRILVLPANNDHRFEQASAEFVQIFEQAQATANQVVVPDILQHIGSMDDLLRTLENQALPYTVRENVQTSSPTPSSDVYQSPSSGVGPSGLSLVIALEDIGSSEGPLVDRTPRLRTQDMVFAVRRHGPPSFMGTFSDSVCKRRLSSADVQSPFILLLVADNVPQHTLSQI